MGVPVVTPSHNPDRISTLADLPSAGVISLCPETAPCGRYAQQILGRAGVTLPEDRVTRGQNAATALAAVARGIVADALEQRVHPALDDLHAGLLIGLLGVHQLDQREQAHRSTLHLSSC